MRTDHTRPDPPGPGTDPANAGLGPATARLDPTGARLDRTGAGADRDGIVQLGEAPDSTTNVDPATARPDPTGAGIDPDGIFQLVEALDSTPGVEPHTLVILRHGRLAARGGWYPYTPDRPQLLYSLSKSFTATALGLAVDAGLVDLDEPFIDFFPEVDRPDLPERTRRLLLRHLASMTTGQVEEQWSLLTETPPDGLFQAFAQAERPAEPGTLFAYNQLATYSIAEIVRRRSGQRLFDFLQERLFEPLKMDAAGWQQFLAGHDLGFTGLFASADSVAKLGQLYLRHGLWNGQRILSTTWVDQASRVQIPTATETNQENPDWQTGYGFHFWVSRHGYRGDGAFGQYCLILPEQDMVVALTSQTIAMQTVLDLVWQHLLPAAGRASTAQVGDPFAGRGLPLPNLGGPQAGLAVARLGAVSDGTAPDGVDALGGRASQDGAAGPNSVSFRSLAVESVSAIQNPGGIKPPPLTRADLHLTDGAGTIRLTDGGLSLTLAARRGQWAITEPGPDSPIAVAVAIDWDAASLRADLLFLETPHHAVLTCDNTSGKGRFEWITAPLIANSLRDLGACCTAGS
ncbi:MAG: beta-lactamase family protein [Bifidobacteriaceae bacterium]|jgi:CubicO group peptidase (beta-lactamase class C family)|nr:beta-lactamase family protein [Bifidobacteriaceae bacterium]